MWSVLPLTWISNLFQDLKIRFDFKSNLTSAISNFSELQHLASYVSRHNAMAYDRHPYPRSCEDPWSSTSTPMRMPTFVVAVAHDTFACASPLSLLLPTATSFACGRCPWRLCSPPPCHCCCPWCLHSRPKSPRAWRCHYQRRPCSPPPPRFPL
jgi:hypothetical protein